MQLRQLEVFCKVAELGSFTKAADALFLSQPGITFHIRSLEQQIGTSLFCREGRQMILTEAGQIFYNYSSRALENIHKAIVETQRFSEMNEKTIRMGVGANLAISYLLPAMGQFFTQVGSIKVDMVTAISDEIIKGIDEEDFDMGLIWGPFNRPNCLSKTIAMEEWLLVLPQDPELETISLSTSQGRKRLNQVPFVLPAYGITRNYVNHVLAENGIKPQVAMELKTAKLIVDAVLNGKGAGLVPCKTIEGYIHKGLLRNVPLIYPCIRPMEIIYKKSVLQRKPFLSTILDHIAEVIGVYMNRAPLNG